MLNKLQSLTNRIIAYQVQGKPKQHAPISELPEVECLNCGTRYQGNFCPCCGQSAKTKRFNTKQTLKHLLFIFTKFDDSFWHTTTNLFVRPGHMIREYLQGHRADYLRPMQMLICLITAYLVVRHALNISDAPYHLVEGYSFRENLPNDFLRMAYDNLEKAANSTIISTLAKVTVLALTCFLGFKRIKEGKALNYAEHFYTLIYINCLYMFLRFLLLPFAAFSTNVRDDLGFFVETALAMWIYSQLLRISWRKSLSIYILAYISFVLVSIAIILIFVGIYLLTTKGF